MTKTFKLHFYEVDDMNIKAEKTAADTHEKMIELTGDWIQRKMKSREWYGPQGLVNESDFDQSKEYRFGHSCLNEEGKWISVAVNVRVGE